MVIGKTLPVVVRMAGRVGQWVGPRNLSGVLVQRCHPIRRPQLESCHLDPYLDFFFRALHLAVGMGRKQVHEKGLRPQTSWPRPSRIYPNPSLKPNALRLSPTQKNTHKLKPITLVRTIQIFCNVKFNIVHRMHKHQTYTYRA